MAQKKEDRVSVNILSFDKVSLAFGGLKVLEQLSFEIRKNELLALIGPNGAGKTTVFNIISRIYTPQSGSITWQGQNALELSPRGISQAGVSRTFQNIRLFREMTVIQNILVALDQRKKASLFGELFHFPGTLKLEKEKRDWCYHLLEQCGLHHRAEDWAGQLAYGQQRRLEIIRALACSPKLLLLDEPAAGMNHTETNDLMIWIKKIKKEFDLSILLIEHDMRMVMNNAERIIVLDHGVCIAEGTPDVVRKDPKVREAYLGTNYEATTHGH